MTHPLLDGLGPCEPAVLPEPGAWFRTSVRHEGRPVWARVPRDEAEGHEDADAIERAWERLDHLDHPAIPRPLRFDRDRRVLYVIAPDGVPLSQVIDLRHEPVFTMTPATVLDVGQQLADVLVHAHERGRPHGHLSPERIWITRDGTLVVWGFGGGPDEVGVARWWPPERARGKRTSGDADQWALGAILAALVTGRLPWRSEDPVSEARVGDASHLTSPVMEQWKPLGRLVLRALEAEPRDRFPSVHPLRQALDALGQRVTQPSDLTTMGEALLDRFGPPVPEAVGDDPTDAPPPPLRPTPADLGPPTAISPEPPPLDAIDDQAVPPPLDVSAFDFDGPTDRDTSPTRVPFGGEDTTDDDTDVDDALRSGATPTPRAAPVAGADAPDDDPGDDSLVVGAVRGAVEADVGAVDAPALEMVDAPTDASSLGGVVLAERQTGADLTPRAWWEEVPIRKVAPWVVGAMVVLLVVYVLGWMW
ncbi:MAG: hypothetical protein H6733_01075 [Alphaproteobacteria bacterium]|nr:hypothetical protein [Alphaproteobacteria bacterium]